SEKSPHDILERVRAVAATGWSGIGIAYDYLRIRHSGSTTPSETC
ncbi:MAG: hypothetical protein QOI01_2532, partial [Mycobacterium sp.]|nr:hypothetical protein [Mycobacterium sp.]